MKPGERVRTCMVRRPTFARRTYWRTTLRFMPRWWSCSAKYSQGSTACLWWRWLLDRFRRNYHDHVRNAPPVAMFDVDDIESGLPQEHRHFPRLTNKESAPDELKRAQAGGRAK